MAAARSRHDVARLLRAHELPGPVDETFAAVLAAQARATVGSPVAAPPRRALKLAGAAVAVLASTVGVAVAANQGLLVPPDPQHAPPATTTSDSPVPGPVDADDAAEERAEDHVARPDASEAPEPREHRTDAPDADDDSSAVDTEDLAPEQSGPAKPDRTKGGTGGEDGPGEGPADDNSGDDGADDSSDDGADESESPEPDESETEGPEADEPESGDGADSSETSDPEPDEATESAGVDESEDAVSG